MAMFGEAERFSRFGEAAERNVERKCEMERNHCGSGQVSTFESHVWRAICKLPLTGI